MRQTSATSVANNPVQQALTALGFFRPVEDLRLIHSLCSESMRRAGEQGGCLKESSGLRLSTSTDRTLERVLVVDIGGSSTKFALRTSGTQWVSRTQIQNNDLNKGESSDLFIRYCDELFRCCTMAGINGQLNALVVVWSNAAQIIPLSSGDPAAGLTALVKNPETYTKGEFFAPAMVSGRDIGAILLDRAQRAGIHAQSLLVGNDVVLTLKGVKGAHAGVIASTGMNCTLVDNDWIYNSELPSIQRVPGSVLGNVDRTLHGADDRGCPLESIAAGMGLSSTFRAYAAPLRDQGISELATVVASLSEHPGGFTNNELASMARGETTALDRYGLCPHHVPAISKIVECYIQRAATLAGVVTAVTVESQLRVSGSATVALDCAFARPFPAYRTLLEESAQRCAGGAQLTILDAQSVPGISAPIIGAARAADEYSALVG